MATNTLAPNGLQFGRNRSGASPSYQANTYKIKKGYATKIGNGDAVMIGTGANQGYIVLAPDGATQTLGVLVGVAPYFDTNLQQTIFLQWWTGTAAASGDVDCYIIDDPQARFVAQVSGGPATQSWIGNNINWLATTNGNPNISGISTLALDAASIATTPTLAFRITGLAGITGGPQDPTNTNPWVEVCLNTSQNLNSTGA